MTAASDRSAAQPATRLLSLAGIVAALGAASCCVIPFLLFALGVSGAWIGNLTALEPYQPIFAAVSLGFMGWGAWRLRRRAKIACAEGYCATDRADRIDQSISSRATEGSAGSRWRSPRFGARRHCALLPLRSSTS